MAGALARGVLLGGEAGQGVFLLAPTIRSWPVWADAHLSVAMEFALDEPLGAFTMYINARERERKRQLMACRQSLKWNAHQGGEDVYLNAIRE